MWFLLPKNQEILHKKLSSTFLAQPFQFVLQLNSPCNTHPHPATHLNYNTIWVITLFECFSFGERETDITNSAGAPFQEVFSATKQIKTP